MHQTMIDQLVAGIGQQGQTQLLRVDVDYRFPHAWSSLSNMIGRAAHLAFVVDDSWVEPFIWGVLKQRGILAAPEGAWVDV